MTDEEREKGFAVRDKRLFAREGAEERPEKEDKKEEKKEEEKKSAEFAQTQRPQEHVEREPESREEAPLPEMNFSNFIFSLSTSALIQLGEIPDPVTNKPNKNLPMAKQTIDILGMLQDKTRGNLTADEESLIKNILYDLRMRYVKASG